LFLLSTPPLLPITSALSHVSNTLYIVGEFVTEACVSDGWTRTKKFFEKFWQRARSASSTKKLSLELEAPNFIKNPGALTKKSSAQSDTLLAKK